MKKILQLKFGCEMTFCKMMCGNLRQKIPTQYLWLGPFAHKDLKILTFLIMAKAK